MKCKKYNHFAKACKTKKTTPTKPQRRPVHALVQNNEEEQYELYIDSITTVNAKKTMYRLMQILKSDLASKQSGSK